MSSCCGVGPEEGTLLRISQGASFSVRWPVTTPDGTPIDISTWTARAQARPRVSSPTVLYSWSADDDNVTLTSDGFVYLTMSPSDTSALAWRRAVYDVELEDPAGNVTKVDAGKICVEREVTR